VVVCDCPPGSRLQKSSGAGAEMLACTNTGGAEAQSVAAPTLLDEASARVAKQVMDADAWGIEVPPKL
jgi:hypothetical protein